MDLDALRHGDLSKLGEAVTDWQQMTKKLADLQKDAETNLKAKADAARWAGVNATVSREFITKTAAEFADAHTQADSIAKILSDTHGELISFRTQLTAAITRGAQQHLSVIDTGEGTFTVTGNTRPDWASDPSGESGATDQKVVDALRDEIQGILTKATQSDNSAATVLRLLVDQAKYGFTDASYADRDSAAKAVAAAEKLAKMAKNPADMSLDDIKSFNRTMETYNGDPLFAEQFATRLGPKGTLQFWTEMTSAHAGARGSELDTMKSLQNNLSLTLASASFSDSEAMQDWKKGVIAERNTNFRAADSFSPIGALGSQVMSSLMREGQYDTEFLDDYRKTLFKRDEVGGENNTDALWVKGYDAVDLVFGDGNGRDPLEGLFEGLSHSPEAATHAFESKPDLDRLLATTAYTDRGPSLGHALEAAVTGVGLGDSMAAAPPHNETQVQIMANIMEAVARSDGGADLVGRGMGESFGHMAASYMPEISRSFGGPQSEAIFLSPSDSPEGLQRPEVARFLAATSLDPAGRAGIVYGESIYTGSLLDAHLSDPSLYDGGRDQVLHGIGRNAGIIEGIVGHSIADADIEKSVEAEKAYNDSLKDQGNFFNTALSAGIGYGTAVLAPTGPAGAAYAGGGGFIAGVAGMAVGRLLDGRELDGALDEAIYRNGQDLSNAQDSVNQQTQWSTQDALKRHHVNLPKDGINTLIGNAVNEGWESSNDILRDNKKRPN
ncbi:hypothetical protein QF032_005630 [Streptomyces achromogenes]|uniref:hypothetical protein n=1 Tax=Streptomyces achromogenes TaxID=67255 RepID=UPI002785AA57|nr:hypothetical protein [Streptomyces achromogenes]MDQ0833786.1 hypothetical protein [Streptomyces achromogenes]